MKRSPLGGRNFEDFSEDPVWLAGSPPCTSMGCKARRRDFSEALRCQESGVRAHGYQLECGRAHSGTRSIRPHLRLP